MHFGRLCQTGTRGRFVNSEKTKGISVGVIASIFLFFKVFYYLGPVISPLYNENMPGFAGTLTFLFFLGCNLYGAMFAVLTKALLKRSTIFGVLFILSAILNFFVLIKMGFRISYGWGMVTLLLYALLLTISLAGISLMRALAKINVVTDTKEYEFLTLKKATVEYYMDLLLPILPGKLRYIGDARA